MAPWRAIGVVMIVSSVAFGCASIQRAGYIARQCSDTPKNAVLTLLQGLAEMSILLIKAVIIEGVSAFFVFGDGDSVQGREVIKQLIRHPEVADAESDCDCSLKTMADTGDPDIKLVTIIRRTAGGDGQQEWLYERTFKVRFEPNGNCIAAVNSTDPEWIRIK